LIYTFLTASELRRARKYEKDMYELYSKMHSINIELLIELKELTEKNNQLNKIIENHYIKGVFYGRENQHKTRY
jgi:hypothetical protein